MSSNKLQKPKETQTGSYDIIYYDIDYPSDYIELLSKL